MYLPPHFAQHDSAALAALMRAHPLATVVRHGADGLSAEHLPLEFVPAGDASGRGWLRGHVARANRLWRDADGADVLAIFQGPDGYVSPSAYASKREHGKVVPTWNYAVVHARGRLRAIDEAPWLQAFLTGLTERHEAARAAPWALSDAPADFVEQMLRAVVGIEIEIVRLDGKWKASQNRSAADRAGVVAAAADGGDAALAALVEASAPTKG